MPSPLRDALFRSVAFALVIGCVPAHAEKLIFSPTTTDISVGHAAHSSLPRHLKCWENAGLDVDVVGIQGATAGMQQIAAKNVSFANVGPEVLMMARSKGAKVKAIYTYSRSTIYRAVALKSSGLTKTEDLRGKTLGVIAMSTGAVPYGRQMLQAAKLDPDKDVQWLPIGEGAQATLALKRVATPLVEDEMKDLRDGLSLHAARLDIMDGFIFVAFDKTLPPAAEAFGSLSREWAGYAPADLICTRRKSWEVKANWKLWYENYNDSLHVPFVHPGSLAKQKVKSRQRASHVETDGSYIAHFTVHGGSRGLLEEDQDKALPRFPNLSGRYTEGTYYPCLLPATLFGLTVDCVWVFELHPKGPDRTTLVAASLFSKDQVARNDFAEKAEYYYRRVDTIVPEDNEAVERQQEGLCLPVGLSGKFTHMETLCHAFDNWVLDQMVDG